MKQIIHKLLPFIIICIGLIIAGLTASVLKVHFEPPYIQAQETRVQGISLEAAPAITPTPSTTSIIKRPASKTVSTHIPTPTPQPSSSATPEITPTPAPAPQQVIHVNLNLIPGSNFSVTVNEGSNQCDVLSQALEQGKISSLNMRFDPNYNSKAVYQINGVGKENSVWWTYKVNGQSPSQGCSLTKANNGDNIEWEYKGS